MSGADRFVSMSLDEVIKHRRHEGGRGGFRRGGRGARGAMMQQRGGPRGAMRGQRGGGFPQRSPGGRIAKNRVQHQQGLHQNMQGMQPMMRGPRGGGRFQRGGPPMPRGRGRGMPPPMQQQQQFNPRMGFSTGHNLNQAGGMRAWSNERPMPSNTVPMRGRGRGGPRGMMRGMRGMRGAPMQNRPVRQPPQHFQQQEEEEEEVYQPVQAPKQPNKKAQMAQQLMVKQEVAQNRLRIATQVLMQRQQQLEEANAAVQAQASLKTRGLRLRGGAVGRVTGIRRGGGVVKRQVDARTAIKQKIVRASVNRQRALQQAQNMPMRVNVPNTRMQMQMQQQQQMQPQQMPHPHMAPRGRPMAARGMAAAAIRRNAVRRAQMTQGAKQLMRNAKQLTLHERFSHQGY